MQHNSAPSGGSHEPTLDRVDANRLSPAETCMEKVAEHFLSQLEAGMQPDIAEYVQKYPELSDRLAEFLEGIEFLGSVGRSLEIPLPREAVMGAPNEHFQRNPLGDYQLIKELGRGGMGVVYEAVQLSLARRVALKVLPFASAFDGRHLQRFKNEAQAAALLHHPNIVAVHAVGCDRGVHYYVMQLIEGQSLAGIIRQLREHNGLQPAMVSARRHGTPESPASSRTANESHAATRDPVSSGLASATNASAALTIGGPVSSVGYFRRIARLMVQAAEALEHAHQLGVVHRDVKPANLLVNAAGNLWVTDFGLAQLQADNGLTFSGDLLGTVRYMSPEQTTGQRTVLDHRTDIYSLGATFYELLTLQPVFDGETRQEVLFKILHQDPRHPRLHNRAIPPELETIVLKALSKIPGDRYGTAADLAADVQRYLDDQPIRARRPSAIERLRKWSRRHPSAVIAAMLVCLMAAIGSFISNRLVSQEQAKLLQEQRKTEAALANEKLRADAAVIQLARAHQALTALLQIGEKELANEPTEPAASLIALEMAFDYFQQFVSFLTINRHSIDRSDLPPDSTVIEQRVEETRRALIVLKEEWKILQMQLVLAALWSPPVLDEVGLTAEQRERLAELRPTWLDEYHAACDINDDRETPEERRQRFFLLAKNYERRLKEAISPQKNDRLGQLITQSMLMFAFNGRECLAALRLPAEPRICPNGVEYWIFSELPDSEAGSRNCNAPSSSRDCSLEDSMVTAMSRLAAQLRTMCGAPFIGSLVQRFSLIDDTTKSGHSP
ncbi:MAG: serine/threonine protein kinase [Planctomycetaceae bacterium]